MPKYYNSQASAPLPKMTITTIPTTKNTIFPTDDGGNSLLCTPCVIKKRTNAEKKTSTMYE